MKILTQISETKIKNLVRLLSERLKLSTDVSNYAPGRKRSWLQYEAPLGTTMPWRKANQDGELWSEILEIGKEIGFIPELGLASIGGTISPHRDAAYADYKAIGINLGSTTFGYEKAYPEYRWVPQAQLVNPTQVSETDLVGGEVYEFNCKNLHWTSNVSPTRWAINLWQVSNKQRSQYETFKENVCPSLTM